MESVTCSFMNHGTHVAFLCFTKTFFIVQLFQPLRRKICLAQEAKNDSKNIRYTINESESQLLSRLHHRHRPDGRWKEQERKLAMDFTILQHKEQLEEKKINEIHAVFATRCKKKCFTDRQTDRQRQHNKGFLDST